MLFFFTDRSFLDVFANSWSFKAVRECCNNFYWGTKRHGTVMVSSISYKLTVLHEKRSSLIRGRVCALFFSDNHVKAKLNHRWSDQFLMLDWNEKLHFKKYISVRILYLKMHRFIVCFFFFFFRSLSLSFYSNVKLIFDISKAEINKQRFNSGVEEKLPNSIIGQISFFFFQIESSIQIFKRT